VIASKQNARAYSQGLLGKPLEAIRKGINDVKAIPDSVKELKNRLDELI
jgi:hypothetical protein